MDAGGRTPRSAWIALAAAAASFHLAYAVPALAFLVVGFLAGLLHFARTAATPRVAFYGGLAAAIVVVAPRLYFFTGVFGFAGVVLWGVVGVWTALFVVLARLAYRRLPPGLAAALAPFLWTGLEYFRCELYYLRFTWVTPGLAFSGESAGHPILGLGVYGAGFAVAAAASIATALGGRRGIVAGVVAAGALFAAGLRDTPDDPGARGLRVAGLQVEGADAALLPARLDALLAKHPEADLVVLPEYTLSGPPTAGLLDWCRRRRRHLVVGGMDPVEGNAFRNTAFVVGPEGTVVFRQAKSVPIQFFLDGLPAERQETWQSPWGRVGICICYDLSFTRVVDGLIRQGAQVLVVPTMDAVSWGGPQHRLHARIGPARALEHGVPVVRVCSSGISQVVAPSGRVLATAPFPGQGETIAATVVPAPRGRVPPDRYPALFAVAITAAWTAWTIAGTLRRRRGALPGIAGGQ
jgi:apolipoprotein N-acyltransferase